MPVVSWNHYSKLNKRQAHGFTSPLKVEYGGEMPGGGGGQGSYAQGDVADAGADAYDRIPAIV